MGAARVAGGRGRRTEAEAAYTEASKNVWTKTKILSKALSSPKSVDIYIYTWKHRHTHTPTQLQLVALKRG